MSTFRNKSVSTHNFAMVPRADIPRSSFRMQKAYKTTFDGGYLVPVFVEEVLPGDTFNVNMTAFVRLSTPLFPTMDNLYLESFFFFVPNRLVWQNWQRFMGERDPNPSSSIDFVIPQVAVPESGEEPAIVYGWPIGSIGDYMGLPTIGQLVESVTHSALPLRAYNLIYNEWFRDQNLQNSLTFTDDNGPDDPAEYELRLRGKRHDYFTSCLPFAQKGDPATISLGGEAPVIANLATSTSGAPRFTPIGDTAFRMLGSNSNTTVDFTTASTVTADVQWTPGYIAGGPDDGQPATGLIADLTSLSAITINELRLSFQVQKLLERDARGGSRYTEIVRAHFGVVSPDARLQRPEYLGGGRTQIQIHAVPQSSATSVTGSDTPQGNLAAFGQGLLGGHGFTQSFTEHGYVIGLINASTDLTYQQGLRRHWSRSTRYDFYFPAFAMLGEQAVLNKEIYITGESEDNDVFGYQERWAEYRYNPSEITGRFRSTASSPLDVWHYSQEFETRPALNSAFISDNASMAGIQRSLAVGAEADGAQFYMDAFFDIKAGRPLPMYSVPGLIDHF